MWALLYFIVLFSVTGAQLKHKVNYLEPDDNLVCCDNYWRSIPYIYCYKGRPKNIIHLWETIQLHLSLASDEFEQFDGFSPEEVLSKIENQKTSWNINFYKTKKKVIKLNPFNNTCIGVVTNSDYNIRLTRIRVDYWRIITFVCGILLFFLAPKLSSNSLFYYICGVSFGTCASVLILIFIVSRLIPKKPMMYSFLVGGWTIGLYMFQFLWDNIRTIALEYQSYVFYYLIVTGVISFIICYRFGPVSDPRSINIIKWLMQGAGLFMIFMSSDFREATLAFIMIMLACYVLPFRYLINGATKFFRWHRPKPRKLLTDDEFHHQGVVETEKALEELRGYCSSPECNQWRTVLRLRDPLSNNRNKAVQVNFKSNEIKRYLIFTSPNGNNGREHKDEKSSFKIFKSKAENRFAKFVEGSSHLLDDEVLSFETDVKQNEDDDLLTDDSSSSTD